MNLSPQLIAFIRRHIESVDQIETLSLLCKDPSRKWSPQSVMDELRTSIEGARKSLAHLEKSGLASRHADDSYTYAPATEQMKYSVVELCAAYKERRVSVINTIYASTTDHIKSISDAFKIRQKGDE